MKRARKLTDSEIERLDRYFVGLDDDAMLLSTLDGFLAGIVVCPELVLPSEWLPCIWGEDAAFENQDEADEILDLIQTRYNEIVHDLGREGEYEPLLDLGTDDTVLWEIWAEGLAAAMALRPESWAVYETSGDEEVRTSIAFLFRLAAAAMEGQALPDGIAEELRDGMIDLVAGSLETLHAARLAMEPSLPDTAVRIGRNDPCPCGSGKKFKKCCMD